MTQTPYAIGQRWISEAEPDLGLGMIIEADLRVIKVAFLASNEERVYAANGAPLSRVHFRAGEHATAGDGWEFEIESTEEDDGLIVYQGIRIDTQEAVSVPETRLAHDMQVCQPQDRLFTNQLDRHAAFELRYETLRQQARLETSPVRGILGPRVDTIPHQLYIANEVGNRPAPRVLLADEVGLGKTIEAGLILHNQLLTERAKRALIIVPKALVSQWVLELMRRFNLHAAIFDEERCGQTFTTLDEETDEIIELDENPFHTEQLAICTLDMLVDNPQYAQQAIDAGWDTLIVDEAHHLQWSPEQASPEYQLIEQLAAHTPGLLLLTATPEQLGVASHFARLRLLDPNRFNDLDAFIKEEEQYAQAAEAIDSLLQDGEIDAQQHIRIAALQPDLPALETLQDHDTRQKLVQELVDRHGTGRVLFRNTRAHVKGFPPRLKHAYPFATEADKLGWLSTWLKSHKDKVLIICAHKETALQLEEQLHLKEGILCAAFHEDLGLLARDRAAAWFAEDMGAQALICSEIGSEGRNFQFAHHLVLLDLPENPDLLEQRIGRLDRIGQKHTIEIHVPYLQNSREEVLFHWYNDGLNSFEKNCPAAASLRAEFGEQLKALLNSDSPAQSDLEQLISQTQTRLAEINVELEKGRDRLLELSSFRKDKADALQDALLAQNDYNELEYYLELAADGFGIEMDHHSDHTHILSPGTHYRGGFKDISDEGTTVTLDRTTALSNEDFKFLTWEHPLITDAFDQVISSTMGNAALGTIEGTPFPQGSLLIECLFVVHSVAPKSLQLGRYLPPQLFRIVIDNQLRYVSKQLPFNSVKAQVKKVERNTAKQIIESQKPMLSKMINQAQAVANKVHESVVDNAKDKLEQQLKPEVDRLKYLQSINPSVRDDEIAAVASQHAQSEVAIEHATIKLDGIRVLITT